MNAYLFLQGNKTGGSDKLPPMTQLFFALSIKAFSNSIFCPVGQVSLSIKLSIASA